MMNPDVALTIESFSPTEEHAFKIDAPKAIQGIVRDIARHAERVALYYDSAEGGVIVTVILEVGPDGFWLDATHDGNINGKIQASASRYFVSAHLQAKVQFPVTQLELQRHDDVETFFVPFPEQLMRLQRRDFFRLYLPQGALICDVSLPDQGTVTEPLRFTVRDISEGGVALLCEQNDPRLQPGIQVQDCRLTLEDGSELIFGLQVRHSVLTRMPSGDEKTCIGCRFITLSARMAAQLQRFITRRQRERLS
ncbi:MAG: hypothetical protein G3I09_07850 [Ferrovum sp.]|nr:hypothetical protein [Ferrovum sp.]